MDETVKKAKRTASTIIRLMRNVDGPKTLMKLIAFTASSVVLNCCINLEESYGNTAL